MTASTPTTAAGSILSQRTNNLFVGFFEWFGELGIFCARLGRAAFTLPFEIREFIRQCDEIGSKSLPLVALAGAATGVVLSLQTRDSLTHFGAKSLLPAVIFYSVIKESGPVITGLVVSGRIGAGIGAELGSMKVTEQIDAMEASAVEAVPVFGGDPRGGLYPDAAPAHAMCGFLRVHHGMDRRDGHGSDIASPLR